MRVGSITTCGCACMMGSAIPAAGVVCGIRGEFSTESISTITCPYSSLLGLMAGMVLPSARGMSSVSSSYSCTSSSKFLFPQYSQGVFPAPRLTAPHLVHRFTLRA